MSESEPLRHTLGAKKPKVVLVGEAWGATEEKEGFPFLGMAGIELAKMLMDAGLGSSLPSLSFISPQTMLGHWLSQRELLLTNVFNLRPPFNDLDSLLVGKAEAAHPVGIRPSKYVPASLMPHVERLWAELELLRPNLVIPLGVVATWAVLGSPKLAPIRGTTQVEPKLGLKVLPTWHPAAVLRQYALRPICVMDFSQGEDGKKLP